MRVRVRPRAALPAWALALHCLVALAHAHRHLRATAPSPDQGLNQRPLIGILTQPGPPAPKHHSYIAASYVKFIEAAGGRVVPIEHDLPVHEVVARFRAINGVLIPGGGAALEPGHGFYDTAALLVDLTLQANDAGEHFPLHGTCLGMEALAIILSRPLNTSILSTFDAGNNPAPLALTAAGAQSRLLGSLPPAVLRALQAQPLAMENHGYGLTYSSYLANEGLRDFLTVTSLSVDRQGAAYISTMEAKEYPVTATQWHPEKNAFEWMPQLDIPHSAEAVEVTQAVANFVVNEARKNHHAPANAQEESRLLIYNWPAVYTGQVRSEGIESSFEQCYFFPEVGRTAAKPELRRLPPSTSDTVL